MKKSERISSDKFLQQNEYNKSNEENTSEPIEQTTTDQVEKIARNKEETANNQIENIVKEQQEIASNKFDIYTPHLKKSYKAYTMNISKIPLSTLVVKYNAHKLTTYQLENRNRTRIKHVLFLNITIGFTELVISRPRLGNTLIQTNQANNSIDR